jgi:hypothetical protein
MTMRVTGPNGIVVNFPDGTDSNTVNSVMGQAMSHVQGQAQGQDLSPNNVVRSVATGVPVLGGIGNNVNAAVNATLAPAVEPFLPDSYNSTKINSPNSSWSDRYNNSLAMQNGMDSGYGDAHPYASTAGQLAGSVGATIAGAGMLPPGSVAPGLGGKIIQGASAGAGIGGADGFTRTQGNLSERLQGAGESGLAGGVFGGAAPVVARGVGATWNVAGKGWQGLSDWLSGSGMDRKAANVIVEQMQAAGHSPESAAALMDKLGPEGMIADAAPVFSAQTARASNEASSTIGDALAQRRSGSVARLSSDLDSVFGPAQDPFAVRADIGAQKAAVNPQYTAAINGNQTLMPSSVAELNPQLADMVSGMSLGNRNAMATHVSAIDDALGAKTPQEQASRLLDLRKNLDAQIVYDPRQVSMLSPADKAGQSVTRQARAIVDGILKQNVGGIAEADAAHAPLSAQQQAFDFGRKQLLAGGQNAISPDEAASRIGDLSNAEKLMVAQGVRAEITRTMGNASNNPANAADRILGRDWNAQKVTSLAGDTNAERLANALNRETTFNQTSGLAEPGLGSRTNVTVANGNPWTPPRAGDSVWKDMALGGIAGNQAGGPPGAALGVATPVVKRLYQAMVGAGRPNPALVANVANKLVAQGDGRDRLLASLAQTTGRNAARTAQSSKVEQLINAMMAPLVIPAARQGSAATDYALERAGLRQAQ